MKKILNYMGVDRAVVYTLASRGWGIFSGVLTLFLVARFLTPDEQGYYYTFTSILAMQVLFELGMSVVVTQFASHEMAHLSWLDNNTVGGDDQAKNRLYSLLILVIRWYGVISTLIIVGVLPLGWIFFSAEHAETAVNWQFAWSWFVFSSALNIFMLPVLAILEGCGCVAEIAKLRIYQNIIGSLCAWIVLISGGGLLAMPVMSTCYLCVTFTWTLFTKKDFFSDLLDEKIRKTSINWKTEIWPFQWRIALSWLSGYFIFQLFTPVLFVYYGAVEAGRMGMSFSLANALMSIPLAWMSTKTPEFGALVAKRDYVNLDKIFNLTLSRSLFVMIIIGVSLCIANYLMYTQGILLASRLLKPIPFSILMLATIFNYVTYAQSAYLRAHKQEPFLFMSIVSAVLIAVLTLTLTKEYGSLGIMLGYLAVCTFVGLGWGSLIFISKRNEWQKALYDKNQL